MFTTGILGIGGLSAISPTISSAIATQERAIDCGQTWRINIQYITANPDDVNFKVRIKDKLGNVIFDDLTTSSSIELYDTGESADALGTGFFHSAEFTVEIVRKSDSVVTDDELSNELTVETGADC